MDSATCQYCKKSFNTTKGLNTHIRMSKSCGTQKSEIAISSIAQISTQEEFSFEPCEDIIEPFSIQIPVETSIISEFLSEPSSESIFDISQFTEVISTNKCSTETHCQTCTCFQEKVKTDSVSTIRQSMKAEEYPISTSLPNSAVRDVCLVGDKILEVESSGKKIYRDVQFKHYNSTQITKRAIKNNFNFEMRNLNQYKKQKTESHSYLNFRNGITEYETIMKYTIENEIKYSANTFNPTLISFDVEAFHPTDKNVVPKHTNGGIISMICATFSKIGQIDRFVVYLLDQYQYNQLQIEQFIIDRRKSLNLKDSSQFSLQINKCENQTIMACQFLDDVKECGSSILYGFNSSATAEKDKVNENNKITERASIGYDLPFIIHNSARYTQQEVEHGAKLFGKIGRQIKKISWLPDCYILDCMLVFQNDRYFAMKLSDMPNRKLNSFLEQAKIPLKEDEQNIYQRMDQMRIKNSDQTDCINYCIWDAYALTQVMNIIKYIETVKANVEIFNIPLSWALHKNPTNWCTMLMLRRFYKSGYAFSYSKFQIPENKQEFRGATTESCPENLIQQVLDNIAMWDFQSLYPNAIIACNLGIDSLLEENDGDCYAINLNFVDQYLVKQAKNKIEKYEQLDTTNLTPEQIKKLKITAKDKDLVQTDNNPNIVYFSKKPSLYATIIAEILQQRLDVKASMKNVDKVTYEQLDARQNALKIFVNTIYGLSGAETFQLCDIKVASACTAVSRKLTYYARQSIEELEIGNVVFRDTDSCAVMVSDETIQKIYQKSKELNDLVNKKLQQDLGNTHIVKFILEGDNFQEKTYFPLAKKAYARIECDVQDIINNKPITRELKIKGVSWSLMSPYGKEFFKQHTEYILLNFKTYDQISEYVKNVLDQVQNDIKTLVDTNNFSEIARKYHKQIKNSQKNKTSKYLRKTFNVTDNEIQILPVVKQSKLKSNCVVPCQYVNQYQIDQNQLFDWFISPFQKFYGKHNYEQLKYDDFETLIECRLASKNSYQANTRKFTLEDIIENLENKSISYNEVIGLENKLFFDIDDAKNETNFKNCLVEIEKMICKFRYTSANIEYVYTKSTSTKKPHSYHLVYQIRASLAMNKYIAQQINKLFDFQIIDEALYSVGKSLRLPNSPKFDEKEKKLVQVYHKIVGEGSIEQMFVTYLDNINNSLSNAVGFIDKRHKELGYQHVNLSDEYISAIQSYIPFQVMFKDQSKGSIIIEPYKKPYICPVCSRQHKSLNMVAYLRKDGFVINCWSGKNKDKKPIKHTFEKKTKTDGKTNRLNQLKEYTQNVTDYQFKYINPANISFQHNQQVQYDLDAQTTFVRSQMMTGKTKQQIKLTSNNEYPTILALSFRRTFARDNAEKNSFVNYENIQGDINLIDYPHLILQVDSLARLNTSVKPSLLIIDEIESILEQLLSIKRDTSPYILFKFIELLQTADKILCLDAELEQSTIEVITQLIGTDNYKVFVNTYKPKTDSKIIIHDFVSNNSKNIAQVTEKVKSLVNDNKKIVVFSTSLERAKEICAEMPKDKIIKYYDGEDAKKINGISQAKIKAEDFADVNKAWANCDILIYTGTLTAGVSFELENFDVFVGIYAKNTASPLGFTQGLHRVRNFADKLGYLYLEKSNGYLPETALQITENQTQIYGHTDLSETNQFANWIEASTNNSENNRLQITIRNLLNMGYNIEIADQIESVTRSCISEKLRKEELKDIVEAQITLEDITKIPKIIKSNALLIQDTDTLLQAKFNKIRIFKSFFPVHNDEAINRINKMNTAQIQVLYEQRQRIANGNKIKNIVKKCLNERPEFKDLTIEQMNQIVLACKLESQQNIKAQFAGTVQKDSILKFHQQIYIVTQALKIRDLMQDLETKDLEEALKFATNNQTLKNIGFSFGKNGIHHKLNEILKHIDLEIQVADSKRIVIEGKRTTVSTYKLISISAESILASL